ncbi:helix-turn-helix domain-containing protein [Kribbella sandramycini]
MEAAVAELPAPPGGPQLLELRRRFVTALVRRLVGLKSSDDVPAAEAAHAVVAADVPPDAVITGFRAAASAVWTLARDLGRQRDQAKYVAMLESAGEIWVEYEQWASAFVAAYEVEARQRDRIAAQEREAHLQAVLSGAGGLERSAEALGMPLIGQFCVVVLEEALPDAEQRLSAKGLQSWWSLNVGIVSGDPGDLAGGRVGVSPDYEQLADTPRALRLARIAVDTIPPGSSAISRYGDRPLEALLVSAPEAAQSYADAVLGPLFDLPTDDRQTLLQTVDVWSKAGGNVTDTAAELSCHRNTVRHRLGRIETLTGRSLSEPRGIAEVLTALQAYDLRVPEHAQHD